MTVTVRATILAALILVSGVLSGLASADMPVSLNRNVVVTSGAVTLGDIFAGADKAANKQVAMAPPPGQRVSFGAEWLHMLAVNNGLNWRPGSKFDQVNVFRPGRRVADADILAATAEGLQDFGLPESFGLRLDQALPAVVVALNGSADIAVRDGHFDAATRTFSALVEIPAGTPDAQFLPLKGTAIALVQVPVPLQNLQKDAVIGANMVTWIEVPESELGRDAILNEHDLVGKAARKFLRANSVVQRDDVFNTVRIPVLTTSVTKGSLISADMVRWADVPETVVKPGVLFQPGNVSGKAARSYIRAGEPIRRADVMEVTIMELPVLSVALAPGEEITPDLITWKTITQSSLPVGVVTDDEMLVGRTARHYLSADMPIERRDIQDVSELQIPVIARDVRRGEEITVAHLDWRIVNEYDLDDDIAVDVEDILGFAARRSLKAGMLVHRRDLRRPTLVRRGDKVMMDLRAGNMTLTAVGRVMQTGARGDIIRVLNVQSQKTILAEVVNEDVVRVDHSVQTAMGY